MQIISKIPASIDKKYALEHFWTGVFPLPKTVADYVAGLIDNESTVVLYSGSPCLSYNAIYIESAIFSTLPVSWHPNTLFIDPKNKSLLNYTIKKLNVKNLLILNSNIFIRYRVWNEIFNDIQNYKKIAERVIISMPIHRFDYNRFKFSEESIAKELGGILLDDTVIICQ